jgi:hypothetical protein
MSNLRLNITDAHQTIHHEVPTGFAEAVIAALTAEPETIRELATALARFIKPQDDTPHFAEFRNAKNFDPFDSGLALIDLAARIVFVNSPDLESDHNGAVHVECEFAEDEVYIPYRISDDWLFVSSIAEFEKAQKVRIHPTLLDTREILYGRPLLEFLLECIARECSDNTGSTDEHLVPRIHAKWLMTPREDLRGMTPREVLLEKRLFITLELQNRWLQWSFTKECPAPLPASSTAYRFSGFGTHEIVVYYELIRYLLKECIQNLADPESQCDRLDQLKSAWINTSSEEYYGRTPSQIIQLERRRLPMSMSTKQFLSDADDAKELELLHLGTPMIFGLDGSNMDDEFEFSFHKTREEYDEEERRRIEFDQQFELDYKAGKYDKPFDREPLDDSPFDESPTESDDDDPPF